MDQNFSVEEVFNSAVSIVRNLPKEGPIKPPDEIKLKFYAYFKQATHGPNDTPKPRFYQIVEVYKWDAWRKLGGMTKEDAMLNYIRELKQIMDTIPKEETGLEDNKHFEDILGKKFYDYWFNQWKLPGNKELIASSDSLKRESGHEQSHSGATITRSNDTQSNSSSGSSMSMLEDTQSAGGDGYKTPTSLTETVSGQMSDQFALAVLRLQHGLDETHKRLNRIERQLRLALDSINRLENQTCVKQPVASGRNSSSPFKRCSVSKLSSFLHNMGTLHWFYLSYPILIYALIRAFEKRRRGGSTR